MDEDLEVVPQPTTRHNVVNLPDQEIYVAEVRRKLDALKTSSAPGPHGLHPKVLHELSVCVASPSCNIQQKLVLISPSDAMAASKCHPHLQEGR